MSIIPASEPPEGARAAGGGYWFTPLPVYLVDAAFDPASPVNAPAAMLWAHIHRHYAWRRRVFPSYATLAEETSQSESAVKRQLSALKAVGALTWGATYGSKGRSSNEYALAPMKPFDFDREVQVRNDPHPPVEVKNDLGVEVKTDPYPQVKNDLGVKSTVDLKSTSSSPVPKPRAVPDPAPKPEEEDSAASNGINRARLFLMALPAPWDLGPADATRLAPQLAAAVSALSLGYDDHLTGQIAYNPGGINNYAQVIETRRIPNLKPPTAGRTPQIPNWCGHCNRGEQPVSLMQRTVELPDGRDRNCPACHPAAIPAAA